MKRNLMIGMLALIPVVLPAWQAPAFEVADIKPSDPSVMKAGKGRMLPGGRIELPGYTVKELILFSYGVTENMISGGPKWMADDRFDIIAKAPADAKDQALRGMMQALLTERFRLATHREDKPMSAYVLIAAKDAPGLAKSSGEGQSQCHWQALEGSMRRRICQNVSMDEFAKQLPNTGGIGIDLPVVDQTGLSGGYDLQFEVGDIESGPTIFAALQKVGLKLESRKLPMPVIVVDSAERPSGN